MKELVTIGSGNLEAGEDHLGVLVFVDLVDILGDRSFLDHTAGTDDNASAGLLKKSCDLFGLADPLDDVVVAESGIGSLRIVSHVLFGELEGERRVTVDLFSFGKLEFVRVDRIYEHTDDVLKSLQRETRE